MMQTNNNINSKSIIKFSQLRLIIFISIIAILLGLVIGLAQNLKKSDNIVYQTYWLELRESDLDKDAQISHIIVAKYFARKTNADWIENEISSKSKMSNKELINYLNQLSDIYYEYHIAHQTRRGVLNPS